MDVKVTYIHHSSFLLEWTNCYWLFDYFKGELPRLDPRKELFVFSSHNHHDHFDAKIFSLAKKYPHVTYLLSNDIKSHYQQLRKKSKEQFPEAIFLEDESDIDVADKYGNIIHIHAMRSTDAGCGFFMEYQGKSIYHAGDLHLWIWPGEPEEDNKEMEVRYKTEMAYLTGKRIDLAFTPLDPRQEEAYALGMNHLLSCTDVRHVFPMHMWDNFSIINQYLREYPIPENTSFHRLTRSGDHFQISL